MSRAVIALPAAQVCVRRLFTESAQRVHGSFARAAEDGRRSGRRPDRGEMRLRHPRGPDTEEEPPHMNRRATVLYRLVAASVLALAGGLLAGAAAPPRAAASESGKGRLVRVEPTDPLVAATERARRRSGAAVHAVTLVAAPTTIRLGGRAVKTWAFNGGVPGPRISLRAGEVLRARVENRLPAPLTVHWHGIALRNDMDGVPGLTQKAIKPGGTFVYQFNVPDPGTFFYHSHVGTQLDRGLYGPLIVQPATAGSVPRREITLLLDDWVDGTGRTPDQVYAKLRAGTPGMAPMPGMDMGNGMSKPSLQHPLGTDTSDVNYPLYLINGRPPTDPAVYRVRPGERIRLRLINAGSDTPFRVALGGSHLTVIAADGYPLKPVTVDTLLIGMGERYDVLVTVPRSGVFPLVAAVEGKKQGEALAVLRAGAGPAPSPRVRPKQLSGKLLSYRDLRPTASDALPAGKPDQTYTVALTGNMKSYRWGAKAATTDGVTLPVRVGRRVRLVLENRTMMWHPIHLHGHTFQVDTGAAPGPRKDTVIVPPMGRVAVDLIADNPGQWALHCHNIYHADAGMLTVLSYVK